ncbi:hypothetical protein HYW19_01530 [Candidatus Woesearchaeota archaeon]|nr:hypothetical protein [Candidatus Woesearchaeota archaeon]
MKKTIIFGLFFISIFILGGCAQQQAITSEPVKNEPKCQVKDMLIEGYWQPDVCVDDTGIYLTENYCEARGGKEGYVTKNYFCQSSRCATNSGTWTRCNMCSRRGDIVGCI